MKYESNLKHRGVEAEFPFLRSRVMGHSFGHDVPSDWSDFKENDPRFGIYTRCGMWTHDEAALLYAIAAAQGIQAYVSGDLEARALQDYFQDEDGATKTL